MGQYCSIHVFIVISFLTRHPSSCHGAFTTLTVHTSRRPSGIFPNIDIQRSASVAASIGEQGSSSIHDREDFNRVIDASRSYLDSLSQTASALITTETSPDVDEDDFSVIPRNSPRKFVASRVISDRTSQTKVLKYYVTLPIQNSVNTNDYDVSCSIGLAIRRSQGGILSDAALDFDSLTYMSMDDEMIRTPKKGGATFVNDVSDSNDGMIGSLQTVLGYNHNKTILHQQTWKDGLVVSSVVRGSLAWEAGVRAGDALVATSATIGDNMWPKSTLDGVRSAISSRKLMSSTMVFEFERPFDGVTNSNLVEHFELALSRPICISIENTKDGCVIISGFTEQASDELRNALQVGDKVLAVESSLGGNMWPVSNVDGVISACTSRIPGAPVKFRFERAINLAENSRSVILCTTPAKAVPVEEKSGSVVVEAPAIPHINAVVDNKSHAGLLKKCCNLITRYKAVHDPKTEKSNVVLEYVVDRVLETISKSQVAMDAKTLLLVMDAYIMCGRPQVAVNVFEAAVGLASDGSSRRPKSIVEGKLGGAQLIADNTSLNLYTGTCLLRAHALSGNHHDARRVLASMEGDLVNVNVNGVHSSKWHINLKTDTQCYNTVIYAASNARTADALEMAKDLYDRMAEPVLFPTSRPKKNLVTYNSLIGAFARAGLRQEAFSIFKSMKDAGVNPDRFTITSLIKAAAEDGDLRTSRLLLKDMKKAGIEADVVTYNTIIRVLCEKSQLFEAKELVVEMESRGVSPDGKTYGLLMNALLKARKPGPCLTLFESACSDPRTASITENVQLYTTAITAAASMGDFQRALELISRMTFSGVRPNMKTLTALMGASLSAGKSDYALEIFSKIPTPDGYATALALRAYCEQGEYDKVREILRSKHDSSVGALSGKEMMSSYNYLFRILLEKGQYDRAIDDMNEFLRAGFIPSQSTFTAIMKGLDISQPKKVSHRISRTNWDDAKKFDFLLSILDALDTRKLGICSPLYISLILEGAKLGGVRKKLASLIVKSRSSTLLEGKQLTNDLDDAKTVSSHNTVTWTNLLKQFSTYRENRDRIILPSVRVRCNDRDLGRILAAEQNLSTAYRRS